MVRCLARNHLTRSLVFYEQCNNVVGCLTAWLVAASPTFKPVALNPEDIDNLADMFTAVVRKLIYCDQICLVLVGFQLFLPVSAACFTYEY